MNFDTPTPTPTLTHTHTYALSFSLTHTHARITRQNLSSDLLSVTPSNARRNQSRRGRCTTVLTQVLHRTTKYERVMSHVSYAFKMRNGMSLGEATLLLDDLVHARTARVLKLPLLAPNHQRSNGSVIISGISDMHYNLVTYMLLVYISKKKSSAVQTHHDVIMYCDFRCFWFWV